MDLIQFDFIQIDLIHICFLQTFCSLYHSSQNKSGNDVGVHQFSYGPRLFWAVQGCSLQNIFVSFWYKVVSNGSRSWEPCIWRSVRLLEPSLELKLAATRIPHRVSGVRNTICILNPMTLSCALTDNSCLQLNLQVELPVHSMGMEFGTGSGVRAERGAATTLAAHFSNE